MVLLVEHPPGREAEREYICEVLLGEFLGLEYRMRPHASRDVTISHVDSPGRNRISMPDVLFSVKDADWLHQASLPSNPLARWAPPRELFGNRFFAMEVPVLYGSPANGQYFERRKDEVSLGIDLFGGCFFMLTRYEEVISRARDRFDRFPAKFSVAGSEGLLLRPIVNEYAEILWKVLKLNWPQLRRKERSFRVLLSHDIDEFSLLGRSWRSILLSIAADLLQRRSPGLATRRLKAYITTRRLREPVAGDPYDTFDFLMDTSEQCGLRSAFNVVAGRTDPLRDPTYDLSQPWVRRLLRRIHLRGHEVGFHPSFGTYRDGAQVRSEFDLLKGICASESINQDVWGGRQHFLRWENPTTWRNWDGAGLSYDSTLGYADHCGFRCGSCYEYPVWDLLQRKALALRERPLVAMEGTLLSYMGYSLASAARAIKGLSDTCRIYNGDFTLLWHNHTLASRELKLAYKEIVSSVVASSAS